MKSKKGFTLIEIIAVTLIIAVLALLVVPSFKNSALTSQIEKVKVGLVELNMAVKLYRDANPAQQLVTTADKPLDTNTFNTLIDESQGYRYLANPARWALNPNTNTYSLNDANAGVLNCKYIIKKVASSKACEVICKLAKVDAGAETECYGFYIGRDDPAVIKKTEGVSCYGL